MEARTGSRGKVHSPSCGDDVVRLPVYHKITSKTQERRHRMYDAKIKIYNDEKKTISITFNEKQEEIEQKFFQGYNNPRKISLKDFENRWSLVKTIQKIIEKIYEDESRGYSENFISWERTRIRTTLSECMEEKVLILYDKEIYDIDFRNYINELHEMYKRGK